MNFRNRGIIPAMLLALAGSTSLVPQRNDPFRMEREVEAARARLRTFGVELTETQVCDTVTAVMKAGLLFDDALAAVVRVGVRAANACWSIDEIDIVATVDRASTSALLILKDGSVVQVNEQLDEVLDEVLVGRASRSRSVLAAEVINDLIAFKTNKPDVSRETSRATDRGVAVRIEQCFEPAAAAVRKTVEQLKPWREQWRDERETAQRERRQKSPHKNKQQRAARRQQRGKR